jgi:hypothetical protein
VGLQRRVLPSSQNRPIIITTTTTTSRQTARITTPGTHYPAPTTPGTHYLRHPRPAPTTPATTTSGTHPLHPLSPAPTPGTHGHRSQRHRADRGARKILEPSQRMSLKSLHDPGLHPPLDPPREPGHPRAPPTKTVTRTTNPDKHAHRAPGWSRRLAAGLRSHDRENFAPGRRSSAADRRGRQGQRARRRRPPG